jgi:hypothetical protein
LPETAKFEFWVVNSVRWFFCKVYKNDRQKRQIADRFFLLSVSSEVDTLEVERRTGNNLRSVAEGGSPNIRIATDNSPSFEAVEHFYNLVTDQRVQTEQHL